MPSFPFREGLLPQQSHYPTCQQEQLHLGALTSTFCPFCFSSLPYDQHCWATTVSAALALQPSCSAPIVLLLSVQLPGKQTEGVIT